MEKLKKRSNKRSSKKLSSSPHDLTLKQRKWLDLYLQLGNATEAAMQAYDCNGNRETAANIGWENVRKLDYTDFLEAAGITDHLMQKKIYEGLEAYKTVSAVNTKREATADSTDFIDVPDFLARHKYLETVLKLKRRLVDRKDITSDDGRIDALQVVIIEDKHNE